VIGIAVVFHTRTGISFSLTSLSENRAVATVGQLMLCGLGLVVALVGAMLLRPPPVPEVAPAG